MPRPYVAAPSVASSSQKSSRTRMFAGPSLVVDHDAPPFSLVKMPTDVAAYSHAGLAGWRFTSKTGAAGRLPAIDVHVAPASSVCHTLLGEKPVSETMTRLGLPRSMVMRCTRRAGITPWPTRVHVGAAPAPSSERYTSPLLWPTQTTFASPSCTAIALM